MDNKYIYFIQETYTNKLRGESAVKIGIAVDPLRRIRELQTGNARRLHLLMKIGPMSEKLAAATERKLHKRFKKWRLVGEWFEPCVIKMMQSHTNDIEYGTEIAVFLPLPNEDEIAELEAEVELDRKLVVLAVNKI